MHRFDNSRPVGFGHSPDHCVLFDVVVLQHLAETAERVVHLGERTEVVAGDVAEGVGVGVIPLGQGVVGPVVGAESHVGEERCGGVLLQEGLEQRDVKGGQISRDLLGVVGDACPVHAGGVTAVIAGVRCRGPECLTVHGVVKVPEKEDERDGDAPPARTSGTKTTP